MAKDTAAEPIRVALCIHGLGLGGAQQIIKTVVRKGDHGAFRYFVYCCLDGPVRPDVETTGATVRILPRHLPKIDPFWALALRRAMLRDRVELVHTHLFGDSLHGYLAARWAARLPVIMTLHAKPEILNGFQRSGYRWLFRRPSTRVVACSDSTRRSFVEAEWPLADEIRTITNGIEAPPAPDGDPETRRRLRAELGLDPEAVVFASIGRLSQEKGQRYLIRAFAGLGQDAAKAQLAIIGTGPLRAELERQARDEGVAERVVFTGFRRNIPGFLPAVDTVVFSSLSEGLPIALLEAMGTARPVVGTELPGILEAVRHEREALIVEPGSVEGLAAAVARMTADADLRSRLGQASRQRFLEHFTAEKMVQDYEDLYRQVAAGR